MHAIPLKSSVHEFWPSPWRPCAWGRFSDETWLSFSLDLTFFPWYFISTHPEYSAMIVPFPKCPQNPKKAWAFLKIWDVLRLFRCWFSFDPLFWLLFCFGCIVVNPELVHRNKLRKKSISSWVMICPFFRNTSNLGYVHHFQSAFIHNVDFLDNFFSCSGFWSSRTLSILSAYTTTFEDSNLLFCSYEEGANTSSVTANYIGDKLQKYYLSS